jgi:hypothetical protein
MRRRSYLDGYAIEQLGPAAGWPVALPRRRCAGPRVR